MRYRPLGRTGIVVSEFCLGTMMLGEWGNTDESECHRMVHRALDAGINFIDTADEYSFGGSEEIVGRALKGRRDDVVLAHLNHRLVQICLRLLRAEIWSLGTQAKHLSRVSPCIVADSALTHPVVIAHGRVVVLGGDNHRLHEEVMTVGTYGCKADTTVAEDRRRDAVPA